MAENQDGAEKSEEATSKKKEDARKEGNVAKSMDLSSGVLLVAAVASMYVYVPYMLDNFENLVENFFQFNNFTITKESASDLFIFSLQFMAKVVLPVFAILFVLAIGINAYQVGFYISTKAIEPKFNKLNFFANFMTQGCRAYKITFKNICADSLCMVSGS